MTASSSVVLSNLAYLIGAVVLAIIGGLAVWLHHRQPKSVDANVESFNRGLRALAPEAGSGGSRIQTRIVALPVSPRGDLGPVEGEPAGEPVDTDAPTGETPAVETGPAVQMAPGLETSATVEFDGGSPDQAVIVDLSRQEQPRHQQRAAPGDGAGHRAGAETG
ncbi:MAG TPA: hypothetical protein VGL49_04760 [Acidimicrobiales bacterium]|jgi:hypothetical protein